MTGKTTAFASSPDAHPEPAGSPRSGRIAAWPLRGGSASVMRSRDLVRGALTALGLAEPVVDDGVLMVSELVTNAFRHAHGPYELRLNRTDRAVVCEVADGSPVTPPLPAATGSCRTLAEIDATDDRAVLEMGRGLEVVWQLSGGCCGTVPATAETSPGKVVWFALSL